MSNIAPHSFVKWAGGKASLVPQLMERIPSTWNRETDLYIESFVGGGALFFALQPKRAVLNDANVRLMRTYAALRASAEDVIACLQHHEAGYRRNAELHYYRIRDTFRDECDDPQVAADLIFLNKAGFNGLYRVNGSGKFNVPWGKNPNATICDADNLRLCSAALQGTFIRWEDTLDALDPVLRGFDPSGALIYCDPPYSPTSKTSNFTAYTSGGFTSLDQCRLLVRAAEWRKLGAYVILSQAADAVLIEQYRRCGFTCDKVRSRRNINSVASKRGCVDEYIIS
jgi:DNA adenine methylase